MSFSVYLVVVSKSKVLFALATQFTVSLLKLCTFSFALTLMVDPVGVRLVRVLALVGTLV